jgi:putative transposon-encoded protein
MTVTIETFPDVNYSKQFDGTTFGWFPDKVVMPAGTAGGIYLPKEATGKQVIAFVLDDDEMEMYVEISGDDMTLAKMFTRHVSIYDTKIANKQAAVSRIYLPKEEVGKDVFAVVIE